MPGMPQAHVAVLAELHHTPVKQGADGTDDFLAVGAQFLLLHDKPPVRLCGCAAL